MIEPRYTLSIRQPWAWLIVNGYKKIENRTWGSGYRGPLFIHASKGMTRQEYSDCIQFIQEFNPKLAFNMPSFESLDRGGIVGKVTMIGCTTKSDDPFFCGPYGFLFKDPVTLPFQPLCGALGIFQF